MEIIQKESIIKIINEIDLVSEIEQGFIAYSNGESVVPPIGELVFDHPPGDVHIKYGYIFGDQFYVIKIASGFWENEKYGIPNGQGMMLLFNRRTGQPEALLLDDAILTDIRTAIAGQICVSKFSNEINKIGVLGTGVQARLQVQYLKRITQSREVVVWGRDAGKMNDYKRDMSEQGFEVTIGISPKDVASKCNLLITATASKEYLLSKIRVALGGRAAEELIYGKDGVTTGASSDYAMVYQIAREMVTTYGFGKRFYDYRNMSEDASAFIDEEIDLIVGDCYDETLAILRSKMTQLEQLKGKLIEEEIVDGQWVYELMFRL